MVCHERIAKREEHDESQHRAECGNEKCGGAFDTAPDVTPQETDHNARRDARHQPDVIDQIRR